MALTQGLLAKLVAQHAPATLRGSAFGLFNLATGVAMLMASVVAGVLWERIGSAATFAAGAGFAVLAVLLVMVFTLIRRAGRDVPPPDGARRP
jgi:MFS family permease